MVPSNLTRPPRPQLDVRGWLQALTERWRIPSLLAPITPLSRLCCFPPRMPQNATNAPDATRMLQPPSIRRTVHDKCQTLRTVCARRPPTCCPSPSPTDRGPQANQKKYRPFSLPSHRTSKSPLLRLVLALTRSPPGLFFFSFLATFGARRVIDLEPGSATATAASAT